MKIVLRSVKSQGIFWVLMSGNPVHGTGTLSKVDKSTNNSGSSSARVLNMTRVITHLTCTFCSRLNNVLLSQCFLSTQMYNLHVLNKELNKKIVTGLYMYMHCVVLVHFIYRFSST